MVSILLSYLNIRLLNPSKDRCSLEGLPIELRILILSSVSDLDSLRSIVLASPAFHQAYRRARAELLQNTLYKEYNGLVDVTDAITAIRSKGLHASLPSNKEKIISLLDTRRRSDEIRNLRLPSAASVPDTPASIDEIIQLIDLHRIATFLLDDYCKIAPCPKWMDETKWKNNILPLDLYETEKVRWLRGFYRLQIFAHIFGPVELPVHESNADKRDDWDNETFTMEEAWRVLFGTMAPWEVAELGCVFQYILQRYIEPYNETAKYLSQYGSVSMDSLPEEAQIPAGCLLLNTNELVLRGNETPAAILAAMGPTFFYKFLRQETFMDRRNLILVNGRRSFTWTLLNICPGCEGGLPLLYPSDRFNFGDDFDGLKQLLATLPPSERPNIFCDRYFLHFFDMYDVFEELFDVGLGRALWQWGYALWEDERLLQWNPPGHATAFN